MLFVAGEMLFIAVGTVFVAGGTVFAMDGAVSLQNRRPAVCQPAALVTFSLHLGKASAPSGVALYTRAV